MITYTYKDLKRDISDLCIMYPFVEHGSIGKSVMGKDLYYIRLGNGKNKVLYVGVHHSLEWLTGALLTRFAKDYAIAYATDTKLCNVNIRKLYKETSIFIVPMLNPDGVELVANGINNKNPYHKHILHICPDLDYSSVWQANIRGVDLNHNYDAKWHYAQMAEIESGIYKAGPTRYGGMYPHSEPETFSLVNFTIGLDFNLAIAYHSQGEEIFYDFEGSCPDGALKIADKISKLTGYSLSVPEKIASYGGFKDWFIYRFNRPAYTIEIGKGVNPIGFDQLNDIIEKNYPAILYAAIIDI